MRTNDALERLAAAGRPLVVDAESLLDPNEAERILGRILASDRPGAVVRPRRRATLLAVGALAAAAVAVVSTWAIARSNRAGEHRGVALNGPRLELAGFHFRTPSGFKASSGSCVTASSSSGVVMGMKGFAAAASADGGCVEAFILLADPGAKGPAEEGATPVSVGAYEGYFMPENTSGESTLYVQLPKLGDTRQYLSLLAERLSEQQLVAIAQSGLPQNPDESRTIGPT